MALKSVAVLHAPIREDLGELITRRPLPGPRVRQVDPFLFLNHHGPQEFPPNSEGLLFPPHPHRGFETVTFVLQGELLHADTTGHESVIHAGGVQWMNAGSGIVHSETSSEEFRRRGGLLEVLQLWINLPPRLKMSKPTYVGLERSDIPSIPTDDGLGWVNLIAGSWNNRTGPVEPLSEAFMSTLELRPGARASFDGLEGRNVFFYVASGNVNVDGVSADAFQLVELSNDVDAVEIEATSDTVVVFGHAAPIGEPVVTYGPFVMNSTEEIHAAIRDYRAGKFGAPSE